MNYLLDPVISLQAKGLMTILKSVKCKKLGFKLKDIDKLTSSNLKEIQDALNELSNLGYLGK